MSDKTASSANTETTPETRHVLGTCPNSVCLAPRRIQRKRSKGWEKPAGAVNVTRPGLLGNPFTVRDVIAAGLADAKTAQSVAVRLHADWMAGLPLPRGVADPGEQTRRNVLAALRIVAGGDLMCWCRLDGPCHADTLLALTLPHLRCVCAAES